MLLKKLKAYQVYLKHKSAYHSFLLVQLAHYGITLTRAKFDQLTHDLVERTKEPVRRALADAGLTASDIDQVLLVVKFQLVLQQLLKLFVTKLVKNLTNQ